MTFPSRVVVSRDDLSFLTPTFTMVHNERSFTGVWSHPDVPLLVFANNALPGPAVTWHGGRIGSGWPVQLLFWGAWWSSSQGAERRKLVIDRTKALLDSPYFSELSQYGVTPPVWRGATIVTEPGAPGGFSDEIGQQALDLINDLVNDHVFPAPDDEKIAFIVLMPSGFARSPKDPNGGHTYTAYYEPPFSKDYYWVAWVRSFDRSAGDDPEDTARTLGHELVEMLTDPDAGGGWYAGTVETGEISDAGVESDGTSKTKQTAWVNGVHVQSYWSNRHAATVIPIDRDYRAQLTGSTVELARRTLDAGSFRPSASDNALCKRSPSCCVEDRDYSWTVVGFDERARVRVLADRYLEPKAVWTIEGTSVSGKGNIRLNLPVQGFAGREPVVRRDFITLEYDARDTVLELNSSGSGLNFDVKVACSVRDASIVGVLAVDVVSEPSIIVGFVGVQVALDPSFSAQREACFKSLTARFKEQFTQPDRVPGPVGPINYDTIAQLPAYVRLELYEQAEYALRLSAMARAVEPKRVGDDFEKSLIEQFPILAVPELIVNLVSRERGSFT